MTRSDDLTSGGAPYDSESLRALVEAGREELPTTSQLRSLSARLAPVFGAAAGGAAAAISSQAGSGQAAVTTSATASGATVALKIGVVLIVSGLAASGLWVALRSEDSAVKSKPGVVARPAMPPAAPIAAPPRTPAPALANPAETATRDSPPAPASARRSATKPAEYPKPSAADEAALLRLAQASVKTDPKRALALTQEHKRKFPNGTLAQEREVIAIEALGLLGQHKDANDRARDFSHSYPGSAHRRKIEAATKSPSE